MLYVVWLHYRIADLGLTHVLYHYGINLSEVYKRLYIRFFTMGLVWVTYLDNLQRTRIVSSWNSPGTQTSFRQLCWRFNRRRIWWTRGLFPHFMGPHTSCEMASSTEYVRNMQLTMCTCGTVLNDTIYTDLVLNPCSRHLRVNLAVSLKKYHEKVTGRINYFANNTSCRCW